MAPSRFLAAGRQVDGVGDLSSLEAIWAALRPKGNAVELVIDPLEVGWDSPLTSGHYRSGCAPIEALADADTMLRQGSADFVLIRGQDMLRSRYAHDKVTRQNLMAIYGQDCPIPEAYNRLAHAFIRHHGIDVARFKVLAEQLIQNYLRTAKRLTHYRPPSPEAQRPVTDLFRAIDCANPVIDFKGLLLLGTADSQAEFESQISNLKLEMRNEKVEVFSPTNPVELLGVGVARSGADGPDHVEVIARYDHLATAFSTAVSQAGIDFAQAFNEGRSLLEAYTCFPVVPLAFLLASGIVRHLDEVDAILAIHPVTVTGGMNLARAPWNNPALNSLIVLCGRLAAGEAPLGAIHGNGGLGYRQGVAILGRKV